ncbi:MAG TPA: type II toxin-antitoxin system HipA family toxin [Bacteroidetes bacterium]|nr:type II toxin-antitoxin system HipA family toxin [Bacteroidota bacterium]
MKRCPITYNEISDSELYSKEGIKKLSRRLTVLNNFPFSSEEQRMEAIKRAGKMSIQGVQPKVSTKLNFKESSFEIVDSGGEYIMKPQSADYPELPQNEDVTMRLAAMVGIETPLHGLIYSKDNSLTYFIKRFDRIGKKQKRAVEDFAQLSGNTRETKYRSSMENVAKLIEEFCTFPVIEKVKLFRLTLFSYLIGNEDMHLKNFSIINRESKIELSPAYDLLNSTIAIGNAQEELALPLSGKNKNFTRKIFTEYFGKERLSLQPKVVESILEDFHEIIPQWTDLIDISFLSSAMKIKYLKIIEERRAVLEI